MTCNDEEGVGCPLEEKTKRELCQYEECISCADEVEADENSYYEAAEVKEVFAEASFTMFPPSVKPLTVSSMV